MKHFLANKGFIGSNDITLGENNLVTTDKKIRASTFNKHCIHIFEISNGKAPKNIYLFIYLLLFLIYSKLTIQVVHIYILTK